MKYLLIVDLMGTLLEARQLTTGIYDPNDNILNFNHTRHKNVEQEYISRITYISRKLNKILENGIKVSIVTSIDHCTEYQLIHTINSIDERITKDNKHQIEYYIDGSGKDIVKALNDRTIVTSTREDAYDLAIKKNKGYYYITIDDNLGNTSCIAKVLDLGGQFIHIDNAPNSIEWYTYEWYENLKKEYHTNDSFDGLVDYYESYSKCFSYSEDLKHCQYFHFPKEETYLKLVSNELDIEQFYFWLILRKIQSAFKCVSGYSFDYTQELINHNCIQIYPSFEQAYQRVLIPKIQENRF